MRKLRQDFDAFSWLRWFQLNFLKSMLRKDERICKECGKVFRIRKKWNANKRVYCSSECALKAGKRRDAHRNSLGTSSVSLGKKSIKNELKRIRNYDGKPVVIDSLSYHDILVSNAVYYLDEDNNDFECIDLLEEE